MVNSGKTRQPGGGPLAFGAKLNRVQEIAAAWRGELLRTHISLEAGVATTLGPATVTVGRRSLAFTGPTLQFFLRPGEHEVTLELVGQEVAEVNGDPVGVPLLVAAGGSYVLTVVDESTEE